jgi:peptidoglycan/LPS O-acetylase OafA/YrhL
VKHGITRYDFIDALRGIAVAGVVLVHTGRQAMPPSALLRVAMNWARRACSCSSSSVP